MKAYRVEDPKEGHGIWRNFDGSWCPVFKQLSDGKARNIPMEDSAFYHDFDKSWFSATDTPDKLPAWFSALDVIEMEKMGYATYEFEVSEWRPVSEYEIVFTRESIISVHEINPAEIWPDYQQLKNNCKELF